MDQLTSRPSRSSAKAADPTGLSSSDAGALATTTAPAPKLPASRERGQRRTWKEKAAIFHSFQSLLTAFYFSSILADTVSPKKRRNGVYAGDLSFGSCGEMHAGLRS